MTALDRTALPGHTRLVNMIKRLGAMGRVEPVTLRDGSTTEVYLDIKHILCNSCRMNDAAVVMWRYVAALHIPTPTAIGGPTMGADVISMPMVMQTSRPVQWFSVRDKPKTTHGLGKLIEGYQLGPDDSVILTDDVANTGDSLVAAYHTVRATGARVLAVMPLVSRGNAGERFANYHDTIYRPLISQAHLGIQPL